MIVTDRDTEQHRHECEARFVSAMPSDAARREYLAGVARRRGPEAAQRLRRDAWVLIQGQQKGGA